MQNVNETLTQYDVKAGKGVMPRLAESWDDQGNGTWRFNLRQGVTFSDGSTFDANDVKHSFERAMSDQLTCETPRYFGDTKLSLQRRRRPHHRHHRRPGAADPAAAAVARDDRARRRRRSSSSASRSAPAPTSSTAWTPGQSIVLERRDDYWGESPAVEKATYVFRTDPAVAAAMVDAGRGRPRAVDLGGRRDQPRRPTSPT